MSDIFLDNLKTATPWIIKQVNLRLLTDDARNDHGSALHIATHLSNLIKVSDRVTVRHGAGLALLEIAPRLTVDQRNEVSVELCRGWSWGSRSSPSTFPTIWGGLPYGCRRSSWTSVWRIWGDSQCLQQPHRDSGAGHRGRHL